MTKPKGKAASKKTTSKPARKSTATVGARSGPRRLKPPKYKSFKLQKRIRHPIQLPNVFKLTKATANLIWQNKKVFTVIILIYGVLNLIFVRGLAGGADLNSVKQSFDDAFGGNFGSLASGFGVFVTLLGSSGNSSSDTAGAYQTFLGLVSSLALIWALRQLMAGKKITAKDAYYQGMSPLITFILVVVVIGLQLIPMFIGVTVYSAVVSNGIAVGVAQYVWLILCALLALLSLYLVTSSVFALYIVTLQGMTPIKALRSARELVRFRRWTVLRKVIWLPFIMLVVAAVIMIPVIIWITPAAQWIFFILSMFALLAIHAYMYNLYRELLNE